MDSEDSCRRLAIFNLAQNNTQISQRKNVLRCNKNHASHKKKWVPEIFLCGCKYHTPPKKAPSGVQIPGGGSYIGGLMCGVSVSTKGPDWLGGGGIWGVVVWGKNPPQPTSGCLASLGDQEWRTFNEKKQPDYHPQAASPASTTTAIGKAGGNPGPLMPRLLKIATRPLSAPFLKGGGGQKLFK